MKGRSTIPRKVIVWALNRPKTTSSLIEWIDDILRHQVFEANKSNITTKSDSWKDHSDNATKTLTTSLWQLRVVKLGSETRNNEVYQ